MLLKRIYWKQTASSTIRGSNFGTYHLLCSGGLGDWPEGDEKTPSTQHHYTQHHYTQQLHTQDLHTQDIYTRTYTHETYTSNSHTED